MGLPRACIKHQREIHGPSSCSAFTVTTGTLICPCNVKQLIEVEPCFTWLYLFSTWLYLFSTWLYLCSTWLYLCSTWLYFCSTFTWLYLSTWLYLCSTLLYLAVPLYLALPLLYLALPGSTWLYLCSTSALPGGLPLLQVQSVASCAQTHLEGRVWSTKPSFQVDLRRLAGLTFWPARLAGVAYMTDINFQFWEMGVLCNTQTSRILATSWIQLTNGL